MTGIALQTGGQIHGQPGGQPTVGWGRHGSHPQVHDFGPSLPREAGDSRRSSIHHVTSKNSGLSPIHRPYYHYYLFLSI
jgi:hypothetical protein